MFAHIYPEVSELKNFMPYIYVRPYWLKTD